MLDADLVAAAIASRAAYDRLSPHIGDKDLSPTSGFAWKLVQEWYAADPTAKSADRGALLAMGKLRITNPKHEDTLLGFIRDLPEPPSPGNVVRIALELKRQNLANELAAATTGHDWKKARELLPLLNDLVAATDLRRREEVEYAADWLDLRGVIGTEKRVPVSPLRLNEKLGGGALPGHHFVLFGRPEAGKSTLSISMAGGFIRRGQRVLYVGNEDNIHLLKDRMQCRLTGMTLQEIEQNPDRAAKLAKQRAEDRLVMVHARNAGLDVIRKLVEKHQPSVLFIDQIRNVAGSGEKLTQKLEANAIDLRGMLATYGLIGVSVTQANDRTERHGQQPPVWLDMGDIDSSRTGLPAQADVLIGVGSDADMRAKGLRALSLPKNKLSNAPGSHEGIIVEFDLARSTVK